MDQNDKYGFPSVLNEELKLDGKLLESRLDKWKKMIPQIDTMMVNHDEKLKERLRKGVPDELRALVWPILAEVAQMQKAARVQYVDIVESTKVSQFDNQIKLDIPRTFQNNLLFSKDSVNSKKLYQVLRAISIQCEKMGYCQGLNYIAASFLLVLKEEFVFWHIFSLLVKYQYVEIYVNPRNAFEYIYVFDHLLKESMPDVCKILDKYQIETFFYTAEWFITLFSSILPMSIFFRVMDVFWYEKIKVIFRTALTIIKIRRDEIVAAKSFEETIFILKDFEYFQGYDQDKFMKISFKEFRFSTEHMNKLFDNYKKELKSLPKVITPTFKK